MLYAELDFFKSERKADAMYRKPDQKGNTELVTNSKEFYVGNLDNYGYSTPKVSNPNPIPF